MLLKSRSPIPSCRGTAALARGSNFPRATQHRALGHICRRGCVDALPYVAGGTRGLGVPPPFSCSATNSLCCSRRPVCPHAAGPCTCASEAKVALFCLTAAGAGAARWLVAKRHGSVTSPHRQTHELPRNPSPQPPGLILPFDTGSRFPNRPAPSDRSSSERGPAPSSLPRLQPRALHPTGPGAAPAATETQAPGQA